MEVASASVQTNLLLPSMEAKIRDCLAETLSSSEFRASQKCQMFLKYVVEETIAGRQDSLKERVIGAAVFGRAPGFETAGDSIVRVKATEVRRRLARHFQDRRKDDLRIELPTGSYVPVFHWEKSAKSSAVVAVPQATRQSIGWWALWLASSLALLAVAWNIRQRATPLELFWAPLLQASGQIVVCTSGAPALTTTDNSVIELLRRPHAPGATLRMDQFAVSQQVHTSWPTVQAIGDLSRMLGEQRKPFQLRSPSEMSFEQMKSQPIVVIGMFSNPWTIELTRQLRFTFELADDGHYLVKDAKHPEMVRHVRGLYPASAMPVDYALITRLVNAQRDRSVVAIGGISGLGTQVAADFATNARSWEQFARVAQSGWEQKNVQILLETRIIGNTPSPPTIVATHVW